MAIHRNIDLYYHVGLGKVASTYLQYKVFPKFKGIKYIQRTKYRKFEKIIQFSNFSKYLVSREFDNQLETEVKNISKIYPNTQTIILLRPHDQWIASQYRRYVKNGGCKCFDDFIDLENDSGIWKIEGLEFYKKIKILEENFNFKPLVLFYDDFVKEPYKFFDYLAEFMGVHYVGSSISLKAYHTSYNEKQLKFILKFNAKWFKQDRKPYNSKVISFIDRRVRQLKSYSLLYTALIVPDKYINSNPLIPSESLEKIKKYFIEDWKKCEAYALENNPKMN